MTYTFPLSLTKCRFHSQQISAGRRVLMDGVTPLQGMDLVIGGNYQKSTHYEIAGKPMEVSVNMGSQKMYGFKSYGNGR